MDVALDKWVAWCLRNTFSVPDGIGLVMVRHPFLEETLMQSMLNPICLPQPWHAALDFDRAGFVAESPGGEDAVQGNIDSLRTQVEEVSQLRVFPGVNQLVTKSVASADAQAEIPAQDSQRQGQQAGGRFGAGERCHWFRVANGGASRP